MIGCSSIEKYPIENDIATKVPSSIVFGYSDVLIVNCYYWTRNTSICTSKHFQESLHQGFPLYFLNFDPSTNATDATFQIVVVVTRYHLLNLN